MIEGLLLSWGATAAWSVFGPVLENLAQDAAKSYVGKCFGSVLSPLNRKPLTKATGLAVKELLKLLEDELLDAELETRELEAMRDVVADFLEQEPVQRAIGSLFLEPGYHLDPALFVKAWQDTPDAPALPEAFSWRRISKRFSRKVEAIREDSAELRETFARLRSAKDSEVLRELSGLPPEFDLDKYAEALVERFASLSLDSLDTDGAAYNAVRLWNVFVPQSIRECQNYRPQLLELPKEEQQRLIAQGEVDARELEQLERERHDLRRAYFDQTPRPVLAVCADPQLPRLVILGDPGSGKSSLLRFLALEWARDEDANRRYTAPLPLLIELRDYNQWDCPNGKGFVSYLHHARTWHRLNQQTLDALLKIPGRVVLLLDGLDEIFDPKEREQAINDIHRFSNDYPDTRIILTSRVVGYKAQRLRGAGFQDFMLQDLDEEQIAQFLTLWHETTFADSNEAERKRERLAKAIKESNPIKMLAGNPLLLTLMAIINRYQELPRDRVLLYEKAAGLLLQQWETERSLQDFPGLSAEIDLRAKSAILRRVALAMQTGEGQGEERAANIIQGERLTGLIEKYLREELHFDQARAAANALVKQLRERNFILCYLGGDSYAFVHRTFLEYFCATEFVHRFEKKKSLSLEGLLALYDAHCRDDDWQEVLRLICGQLDEQFAGEIIEHLTDRADMMPTTISPDLILAVWCLSEVKNIKNIDEEIAGELLLKVADGFLYAISGRGDFSDDSESLLLLAAVKKVGERWPGKDKFDFTGQFPGSDVSEKYNISMLCSGEWPIFLAAVFRQRSWIEQFRLSDDATIRYGVIEALVEYWPDEDTRQLLTECAVHDEDEVIRQVTLEMLAEMYPKDVESRRFFMERAEQDVHENVRNTALELLVEICPKDDENRQFLLEREKHDVHKSVQCTALKLLLKNWLDNDLAQRIIQDEAGNTEIRIMALKQLVKDRHGEATRQLLKKCVIQDGDPKVIIMAVKQLIENWRNEEDIRRFLLQLAEQPDDNILRLSSPTGIATRRTTALQLLAKYWHDDENYQLLMLYAVEDEDRITRQVALKLLAKFWLNYSTRQLLRERASVDGELASLYGKEHSRFGEMLFYKHLLFSFRYLIRNREFLGAGDHHFVDPQKSISFQHVKIAAKAAGIPPDKIKEAVRSLSEHMGWDITKGSEAGKLM